VLSFLDQHIFFIFITLPQLPGLARPPARLNVQTLRSSPVSGSQTLREREWKISWYASTQREENFDDAAGEIIAPPLAVRPFKTRNWVSETGCTVSRAKMQID